MKVSIRRVSLRSLGKVGCLLGTVAAFLPSLLCGLLGITLVNLVVDWLGNWQDLSINLLGQEVATFDMLHFLGLEGALGQLQALGAVSGAVLFLLVLALAVVSGALLALIIALVGLVYNLLASATGGLVVEMAAVEQSTGTEPADDSPAKVTIE